MKFNKLFLKFLILIWFTHLFFFSCGHQPQIAPFKSDGCSLFPDKSLIDSVDWSDCCLEHDVAYWQGGTEQQRLEADSLFKDCILQKTGNKELAELMYEGVRLGGGPNFPTWYRWGYGWNYMRKYKPLTEEEKAMISKQMDAYFEKILNETTQ